MSGFGPDGSRGPTEKEAEAYYKQVVLHSSAFPQLPELAQPPPQQAPQQAPPQAAKKAQRKDPRGFHYGKAKPPVYLHFSPSEAIDERDLLRIAAARAVQKTIEDDIARARARKQAWACKLEFEKAWSDVFGAALIYQGYPKDYMSHWVFHQDEKTICEGYVAADGTIAGCSLGIPDFFDSHKLPETINRLSRLPRPVVGVRPGEQQTALQIALQTALQTEQPTKTHFQQPRQLSVSNLPESMRRGLPETVANALEPFQKEPPKKPSARALLKQLVDSHDSAHRGTSSHSAGSQGLCGSLSQKASSEDSSSQKASFLTGSMNTGSTATRLDPNHPEFVPQSRTSMYPDFSRPQNNSSDEDSHPLANNDTALSQDHNQSLVAYHGNTNNSQAFTQDYAGHANSLLHGYSDAMAHAYAQAYSAQSMVPYHSYSNEQVQAASHVSDGNQHVHSHGYDVPATYEPSHSSGEHAGHHQNATAHAAAGSPAPLPIHGPVPQRPYPIIQMHRFGVEGHTEAPPLPQLPYAMEPPPPPSPPQTVHYSPNSSSAQASSFWLNQAMYMQQLAARHKYQQEQIAHQTQQAMIQTSNHHRRQESIVAAPTSHMTGAADHQAMAMILNAQPGQTSATNVRAPLPFPMPLPLEAASMKTPIFGSIPETLQTQTSMSEDLLLSSPIELPVLQPSHSAGLAVWPQSLPTATLALRLQSKHSSRLLPIIQTVSAHTQAPTKPSVLKFVRSGMDRPPVVTYRGPEHLRHNDSSPPAGPAVRPGHSSVLSMTLGQAITPAEQHLQDSLNGNTAVEDDSEGDVDFSEFLVDLDSEDEDSAEDDEAQAEEGNRGIDEEPAPQPQPSARALFPAEFDEDEDVSYFDVTQSEAALYHVQNPPPAPPAPPQTPPSSQLGDYGSDDDDTGELVYIPYTFRLQPIPSRESRAARAAAVLTSSQPTPQQQASLKEYSAGIIGNTMDKMEGNGLHAFGFGGF